MNVEVTDATNTVEVVEGNEVVVTADTTAVEVAVGGAQGPTGPTGPTGPQGPSGVVAVTAPITNSGTSTSANIGITVGTDAASVASGDRGLPAGGTAGQVLAKLSATDYDDAWIAQTAGSPLVFEWWTAPKTQTNFNIRSADSGCWNYGFRETGAQANPSSASITYQVALSAGTYEVELIHITGGDRANYTITIGGQSVGVVNGYQASVVRNILSLVSGFVLSTAGLYDLVISNPTKSASSAAYRMYIQSVTVRRTA